MKKRYQIDKERAVQEFRRLAAQDDQPIQLVIPLKEVMELVQRGLMNLALRMFTEVAEGVMDREVTPGRAEEPVQSESKASARGSERGYCVLGGQKVPLDRPRVRDRRHKEVPPGSYELMQRASPMEESVWQKMMHGLKRTRAGFGMLASGARGATQVRGKDGVHPEIV